MGEQAVLRDVELRKVRANRMIELRIVSTSLPDVAQQFGLTVPQVQNEIRWYIKNGYLADTESQIIGLTGEAIRVYTEKLKVNDADVAKHVLDIAVKLGDRFQKQGQAEAELGLRAYVAQRRAAKDEETSAESKTEKDVRGPVVTELPRVAKALTAPVGVDLGANAAPVDAEFAVVRGTSAGVRSTGTAGSSSTGAPIPAADVRHLGEEVEDDEE